MLKNKDQEVNNILKDVETTVNNPKKNNDQNQFQSIDDIQKYFNNNNYNNMNNNNLYGNNNIRDTKINNIFKKDLVMSDSFLPTSKNNKGPVPLKEIKNMGPNRNEEPQQKKSYKLNPDHEHKINAIINLLEDLTLENLMHVRNQIIRQINANK